MVQHQGRGQGGRGVRPRETWEGFDHENAPYPKYSDYEISQGDLEEKGNRGKWDSHKNPFSKEH